MILLTDGSRDNSLNGTLQHPVLLVHMARPKTSSMASPTQCRLEIFEHCSFPCSLGAGSWGPLGDSLISPIAFVVKSFPANVSRVVSVACN